MRNDNLFSILFFFVFCPTPFSTFFCPTISHHHYLILCSILLFNIFFSVLCTFPIPDVGVLWKALSLRRPSPGWILTPNYTFPSFLHPSWALWRVVFSLFGVNVCAQTFETNTQHEYQLNYGGFFKAVIIHTSQFRRRQQYFAETRFFSCCHIKTDKVRKKYDDSAKPERGYDF